MEAMSEVMPQTPLLMVQVRSVSPMMKPVTVVLGLFTSANTTPGALELHTPMAGTVGVLPAN
jgi:hypothetical protein